MPDHLDSTRTIYRPHCQTCGWVGYDTDDALEAEKKALQHAYRRYSSQMLLVNRARIMERIVRVTDELMPTADALVYTDSDGRESCAGCEYDDYRTSRHRPECLVKQLIDFRRILRALEIDDD